jgi:hypothetical protein
MSVACGQQVTVGEEVHCCVAGKLGGQLPQFKEGLGIWTPAVNTETAPALSGPVKNASPVPANARDR